MKSKKLTITEIVNLLREGRGDEIPKGYKIKWLFGRPPGEQFRFEIPGEDVTVHGNDVPTPRRLIIAGEYVPFSAMYVESDLVKLDYGEVNLYTSKEIRTFEAVYDTPSEDCQKLMQWVKKTSEIMNGRTPKKKEATFDMKAKLLEPNGEMSFMNVFVDGLEFVKKTDSTISELKAKLSCEYSTTKIDDFFSFSGLEMEEIREE